MMPLSASSSHDLRISSKQGRKSDAEIKGRNTNSNREDLDTTLWSIVQEHVKKDELVDMKEIQLWVDLRRLY